MGNTISPLQMCHPISPLKVSDSDQVSRQYANEHFSPIQVLNYMHILCGVHMFKM